MHCVSNVSFAFNVSFALTVSFAFQTLCRWSYDPCSQRTPLSAFLQNGRSIHALNNRFQACQARCPQRPRQHRARLPRQLRSRSHLAVQQRWQRHRHRHKRIQKSQKASEAKRQNKLSVAVMNTEQLCCVWIFLLFYLLNVCKRENICLLSIFCSN